MVPRPRLVALVLAVLVAGVTAGAPAVAGETPEVAPRAAASASQGPPPDPDSDVVGWEDGYWHNESIDVDQSDGLDDRELAAFVARTMARVEYIRGLEFTDPVTVEFVDREELAERRRGNFGTPGDDQLWEALFVFGEDANASRRVATLTRKVVIGYAAEEGADHVVIVNANASRRRTTATLLAHELVHVLQDQHFDLSAPRYDRRTFDGKLGRDGLVEGEASYVERRYAERCGDEWECVDPPPLGWSGADREGPYRFHRLTFQPYSDGAHYVARLRARGGWAAVDAAHEDPPPSSERIVHPDSEDRPVPMTFEDRSRNGWRQVGGYRTIGEAGAYMMLWRQLYGEGMVDQGGGEPAGPYDAFDYNDTPTAGWGNDRLYAYASGDARGYVWKSVWDSVADAREFAEAYRGQLEKDGAVRVDDDVWELRSGPFADAFRVVRRGDAVVVVNGPTVEALDDIRPTPTPTASPSTPTATSSPPTPTPTPTPAPTDRPPATTASTGTSSRTTTPGFGFVAAVAGLAAALVGFAAARGAWP